MRSGGSIAPSPYMDYEQQCIIWRQSLSEANLRDLASDFLMGRRDDSTADALTEYEDRYGPLDHDKKRLPGKDKSAKRSKRSAKRRSSRYT